MWKKKATTNSQTTVLQTGENSEGLIRAVEPLPTYRAYAAGAMGANEVHSWAIADDSEVKAIRLLLGSAPTGTLTIELWNPNLVKEAEMTLDLASVGTRYTDAWIFSPDAWIIPAGYTVKAKCSRTVTQLTAYLCPILLDPPIYSVK